MQYIPIKVERIFFFFFFFYLVLERKSFSLLQTMVSEGFGAFNLGGFYGFNGLI